MRSFHGGHDQSVETELNEFTSTCNMAKLTMPHDAAIARSRISKFLFFLPSSAYDVSKTVDTRCNMAKVAWRALSMGSVEP